MNLLKHVAIIMDGNGRWGLKHKKSRNAGHKAGITTVEKIIKETIKNKIKLGIIPLGSGNSLASNLMIPKEKEGALKLIKEGFYRK